MDNKDKKITVTLPGNVIVDYSFERTLKTFIKQIDKIGILKEVKMRRYYTKPSELKRKFENERRRNNGTTKNQKRRKNK